MSEPDRVLTRDQVARVIRQIDECLNDDAAWSGEALVELLEDVRAALSAGEEQHEDPRT